MGNNNYYSFLRGAIVFGDICHKKEVIFGPAVIQAYEMERKVAKWPRVVVDPQLIDLLSDENKRYIFDIMLSKDMDGLPFIDYLKYIFLSKAIEESTKTTGLPWDLPSDFVFRQHKSAIWHALREPRLRRRVVYGFHKLSIYHNDCIDKICEEFEDGRYFPTISQEIKTRYIPFLKQSKIDLSQFFERYHGIV
jgi:hypothetical protein